VSTEAEQGGDTSPNAADLCEQVGAFNAVLGREKVAGLAGLVRAQDVQRLRWNWSSWAGRPD